MKIISVLLTSLVLISSTKAQPLKADKWIYLFDGKTTAGWHTYGKTVIGKAWKAENGTLHLDLSKKNGQTVEGGDIVSNNEYDNFHLMLEWKISEGGNSGIMFYVHEDTSKYKYPWETGPEMQILDNEKHPDGKFEKHHAGDLYDLISISNNVINPVGEWNQVEIIANNDSIIFVINGERVLTTRIWDNNWNKLVAGSKFNTMTGFGKFRKGKISLQDHGSDVWFRNIRIKKL